MRKGVFAFLKGVIKKCFSSIVGAFRISSAEFERYHETSFGKRLMLYLLLTVIVGVSIMVEITLEFGEPRIRKMLVISLYNTMQKDPQFTKRVNDYMERFLQEHRDRKMKEWLAVSPKRRPVDYLFQNVALQKELKFPQDIEKMIPVLTAPLTWMQIRALVIILIIFAVSWSTVRLFARFFASPLQKIIVSAKKLADGELGAFSAISGDSAIEEGELAELVKVMGEVAAGVENLIVIMGNVKDSLSEIEKKLSEGRKEEALKKLRETKNGLSTLIEAFHLTYKTRDGKEFLDG